MLYRPFSTVRCDQSERYERYGVTAPKHDQTSRIR